MIDSRRPRPAAPPVRPSAADDRALGRFALGVGLLVACLLALPLLWPRDALVNLFYDDAFYYFVIARNLVAHGRFTFDGLHATNGFHPLWLFLVTPLFAVFGGHGHEAPLRAVVVVQALLDGAASYLIARTLGARVGRAAAGVAALTVVAVPTLQMVVGSGLESALVLLLLVRVWRSYLRAVGEPGDVGEAAPGEGARLGLVRLGADCALAFLARPEAIVAVVVVAAALYRRRRLPPRAAPQLAWPVALAALAYVGLNEWTAGVPFPISGLIKSNAQLTARLGGGSLASRLFDALPFYPAAWLLVGSHDHWLDGVAWALFVLTAGVTVRYRRQLARRIADAGIGLPLAVCACFWLLQTALLRMGAPWYGVWLVLALALLAGALVAPLRRARLVFYAFVLAALFRGALHTERGLTNKLLIETQAIRAALWIRGQLADGEPIGSWNAGVVAYYCDCTVVNLDGLVNDYAFYREVIEAERMPAYLAREHIHWLVDNILSPQSYARPMFGLTSEQLAQQPMTLVQSFCRVNEPACDGFGAWRLSP